MENNGINGPVVDGNTPTPTPKNKNIKVFFSIVIIIVSVFAYQFFIDDSKEQPSLNKTYEAPNDLPENIRKEMEEMYQDALKDLEEDPERKSDWLSIAILEKNIGNLEKAEEIWVYLTKHWPENTIAYNNLGDLYQYHLSNFEEAERVLLVSLSIDDSQIPTYRNLHDLYRYRYQTDTNKAEKILQEGLVKNPSNTDLLISLAQYYKDTNDTASAKTTFMEAAEALRDQGNDALADRIESEEL